MGAQATPIKGTDSAYDPDSNRFLVVASCYTGACPFGSVYGAFADTQGNLVGSPFPIKSGAGGGHFPRVRFSPDVNGGAGGFLVAWVEEGNGVHTRAVAKSGSLVGSEKVISTAGSDTAQPWLEGAPALAYSSTSQRFLVAWAQVGVAKVVARLVGTDGAGVGSLVTLSTVNYQAYYTGVTWDSSTNHFGVSFIEEDSPTVRYAFARVSPSDGSFTRQTFNQFTGQGGATDVDYNPATGRFIMAAWQGPSGGQMRVLAWEINSSGNVIAAGVASTQATSLHSVALARNPTSGTYLLVVPPVVNDSTLGIELNGRGFPQGSHTTLASTVVTRYARVAANTESAHWDVTFSDGYFSFKNLIAATTTTGGGSSTAHPAPGGGGGGGGTPPPPPPPGGCTTPQPASTWTCVNGNWLPPGAGGTPPPPPPPPPPGGCTTPQPASTWTCVNGNWLPPGAAGTPPPPPPPPPPSGCTTQQPGPTWTCVNGNWLPPAPSTCSSTKPGSDWVCVNGNWLPPGMVPGGGGSGGGGTPPPPSSLPICTVTTGAPGSGWVKVGPNWVPPSHPSAAQGTCRAP